MSPDSSTVVSQTQIIRDVHHGERVRIYNFVNLYGCTIGDDTRIGSFVEIQRGAVVGARCKIQSHTFICEGVTIGDDVFVGHGVMFINDRHPRSSVGGALINDEWELLPITVGNAVSIGSNATIMAGVRIGEGAVIGAGAMVLKDVPSRRTVVGNPGRLLSGRTPRVSDSGPL